MEDYRKRIDLGNGIVEEVNFTTDNYCGYHLSIVKTYKGKDNIKTIRLNMWDDFAFTGYSSDNYNDNIEVIDFKFDSNDPLYFPLNRLLEYQNPIIIDDDETYGELRKYMEIKKEDDDITITFNDTMIKEEDYDPFEKWRVFIKNIAADSRSKIEDDNLKYKLIEFFREVQEIFSSDYHQISIDEYLELNKNKEKVLKK